MPTGGFFLEISMGTGAYILPSPAPSCPAAAPSTSSPLLPHSPASELLLFPLSICPSHAGPRLINLSGFSLLAEKEERRVKFMARQSTFLY